MNTLPEGSRTGDEDANDARAEVRSRHHRADENA